jgi:fermentation-respiration switch protein FrsA (DUF1100 family)
MKNFIALLAITALLMFGGVCGAADVTLEWDPNSEQDLAGYKIYYGYTPRPQGATRADNPYPHVVDVGAVTAYTIAGLADGAWCFAATAYNASGAESEFSNEICTAINSTPPAVPAVRLKRISVTNTVDVTQ